MRIVLDTNVFISGVFFTGPPFRILQAWRDGLVHLVISPEVLEEYRRVGERLASRFPQVDLTPSLILLAINVEVVESRPLEQAVCDDPAGDKFLSTALAGESRVISSGDRHLLRVSGYRGIEVLRPRAFVDRYLGDLGDTT